MKVRFFSQWEQMGYGITVFFEADSVGRKMVYILNEMKRVTVLQKPIFTLKVK